MNDLPPLNDPHVMPADAIASIREKGHAVVRGLASADEVAAFRPAIESAVQRHAGNQVPLEERGTYGKAFLQVTNIWQYEAS
ncbi:MAG: phytanoyl-CoA dioxygenase family protein, partial [Rhizomicrobium sp.]